ncbi:MAG TPA: cytochrome c3 family protein [Deltaproteobacteria bacterium]|nr:cytochrome c3 family protein [Deltaproteobacteria bacterium]HOI06100.1 cytochrome c3 family protein [Deltaproteobacteria bacterium]
MNTHRYSQSGIFAKLITLALITSLGALLLCTTAWAAPSDPKRLSNAQPGDCLACHAGGKKVLPDKHLSTKGMSFKDCMPCHEKDEVSLRSKLPSSHVHTLSGISCQACHGKKTPFAKMKYKDCLTCHSTETLAKAPARGHFLPNPHNSHYGTDVDCSLCHFQHKKSENMCTQCHDFKNVTPSPLEPLKFLTKPVGEKVEAPAKPAEAKAPAASPTASEAKAPAASGKAQQAKSPAPNCTTCHNAPEFKKIFSATKHGGFDCTVCHKGVSDIPKHMQGAEPVDTSSCLTCHKTIGQQGFHATVKKFSCAQCHPGVHPKEAPAAKVVKAKAPAPAAAPSMGDCTSCHSGPKYEQHFAGTGHGKLSCTTCHSGITDLAQHMKKGQKPGLISCGVCHKDIEKKHEKSAHTVAAKLSCLQCHTGIHPEEPVKAEKDKASGIAACVKCHNDKEKYVDRGHAAKVLAGNKDSASCSDCHGVHDTPVFAKTAKGTADKREHYTGLCITCHKEGGVAGSYGAFPRAVTAYGETYHGKAKSLGYLDEVAGCADCHLAHNILPPDNPASALNQKNLVDTCGKCHKGFHPRFASYVAHPDPDDPKGFLSLYLTKKFMIALLAGVFLFFWAHSLLWWRKAYAEKSCLIRGGGVPEHELPEDKGRQYVRRFGLRERIMHVVLILSFFGVVISGFPIKYTGASWAKPLVALMGGPAGAALVHRVSAGVMCLLFLYTCWLSLKFLFPGFKFKGWVGRLFGPDSLFPRLKDFEDCFGMFKWFFNAGEKPKFDRWTYWEKFDFMAVFWGMFVIGLSGIVMWLPELASFFMPGWMINIVHLAHSEEAFLAAVFIFTIHFFNNHLVPDKFPLERNVFTGSYTLEALKQERPLEYERIVSENRLEEIRTEGPSTGTQLFAGVFGLASVIVGLALTVLIFWAVFSS